MTFITTPQKVWLAKSVIKYLIRWYAVVTDNFLFDRPGLFEVVLLPQIYNARRFDFGFADKPHIARIERSCLAMTEFQRAHPGAQPDNPENT